jgi:hypothetical protein
MLELMLDQDNSRPEQARVYQLVDLRRLGSVSLYTGPIGGFDFPMSGFQFRFHERAGGSAPITGGKISSYDRQFEVPLDNYQIAMGDLYAKLLKIKPIDFDKEN